MMGGPMADPLALLAARLRPAFDAVAGRAGVDPVVRPSDRADAQANGALPLAKAARPQPPRRRRRTSSPPPTSTASADGRDRRARASSTSRSSPRSSAELVADVAADDRLGVAPTAAPGAGRRRLLGAERGQGDAHRAPPHDGHRRRPRPHARAPSATTSCARTTSATGAGRSACSSSTSSTSAPSAPTTLGLGDLDAFYKEANGQVRRATPTSRSGPAPASCCCSSATPETIALWRALVAQSADALERRLRASSACCSPTTTSPARAATRR